ncbi:hypothetical protein UlMin_007078 [Ulmus minor]
MGLFSAIQNSDGNGNGDNGGRNFCWGFRSVIRKKEVDSVNRRRDSRQQLDRKLSAFDLVAIGVGATVGAGVYILVGTVAREHAGPALTLSFLIAGLAAGLSAFCYAELACRCPSAGSAYHYTYICIGEGIAWLVGWSLILEYTIGGAAVARGITPNLALFFGGEEKLPAFLARHTIPELGGVVIDPCAAILVIIVTVLLCLGIKESTLVQKIVTTINVSSLLFIIIAGGYLGFKNGWVGYEIKSGYFPFGINGMFAGSAIVFFSYIGFDSVTSTAEEVINPQRDLPLGIGIALSVCCILYMLVSAVIVGLVPYYALDPDTPISSIFSSYGVQWPVYIITTGAVTALFASLLGSILPQPRILMAMARDGLLWSSFSDINEHTRVPVKGTVASGVCATVLAFFMDVSQLAGMVSVGTLLAFTSVAVSVLIIRYVPPNKVPLSPSLQESLSLPFGGNIQESEIQISKGRSESGENENPGLHEEEEASLGRSLIEKDILQDTQSGQRRKFAAWAITFLCVGIIIFAFAAASDSLPSFLRCTFCAAGGLLISCSLIVLVRVNQDDARHNFGHAGGYNCPFVPFLPATCIFINTYLLIDLGAATWIRVSVWLVMGVLVYVFYGRRHSKLLDVVYVSSDFANAIYHCSSNSAA